VNLSLGFFFFCKFTEAFLKPSFKISWGTVAHVCNPSYSGGRSGSSRFEASPGQIVCETLSRKKTPITKKKKKDGGEALSSNPQVTKKKKGGAGLKW
jgi:hypothetical protein